MQQIKETLVYEGAMVMEFMIYGSRSGSNGNKELHDRNVFNSDPGSDIYEGRVFEQWWLPVDVAKYGLSLIGGHAVTMLGYGPDYILCQNSWSDWGISKNGDATLSNKALWKHKFNGKKSPVSGSGVGDTEYENGVVAFRRIIFDLVDSDGNVICSSEKLSDALVRAGGAESTRPDVEIARPVSNGDIVFDSPSEDVVPRDTSMRAWIAMIIVAVIIAALAYVFVFKK